MQWTTWTTWTTWICLLLSQVGRCVRSEELYYKQRDWQWRDLPTIFDLNQRQDREDWRWTDGVLQDREAFRKSPTNNVLAWGELKKTSRLAFQE